MKINPHFIKVHVSLIDKHNKHFIQHVQGNPNLNNIFKWFCTSCAENIFLEISYWSGIK